METSYCGFRLQLMSCVGSVMLMTPDFVSNQSSEMLFLHLLHIYSLLWVLTFQLALVYAIDYILTSVSVAHTASELVEAWLSQAPQ